MLDGRKEEDRRIYERSARLILLIAMRDVLPEAKVRFQHSLGRGVYMTVEGVRLGPEIVQTIENRMREITRRNLPIVRSRITKEEAAYRFSLAGQDDTVRLLAYRPYDFFDIYTCYGNKNYEQDRNDKRKPHKSYSLIRAS